MKIRAKLRGAGVALVLLWGCAVALAAAPSRLTAQEPNSSKSAPEAPAHTSAGNQQKLARARHLLELGSNVQAITILREVLRDEPENGDAHLLLGSALALVPQRTESLQELEKAVELQPSSAVAHFSLGTVQARFGDSDAARQSFTKALQLDPKLAEAHVSLAMILGQQQDLAAARGHLNEAIHIYGSAPAAAPSHYLLARVMVEQNQPDAALAELDRAIALRPDYSEAFLSQGLIRKWQHHDDAAIVAFQKAAALSPDDFDAQYELGSAYLRAGEALKAIDPLRQAARLKPDDRSTWYQLCMALQKAGKPEEAKACQQELATKINSGLATAANELTSTQANNAGVELEKAGDLEGALAKYREAMKLDPKVTVFRRNMALALCRLGRWDEGVRELREVLKEDPDDAQATKALYIALENVKSGQAKPQAK
jgi:tetratricopeptide (TPR) repeat protein